MTNITISIEINNLHKYLKSTHALRGLGLTLRENAMHGIIGPEGAGKTTLMRLMTGLLTPSTGQIKYLIDNQETSFAKLRDGFAYMPQHQSLYPDLSVAEHLDFFKTLYQIPADVYQKRRAELLHLTRMEKFQNRPAGKLSGGMYKKLGLMCSLLRSPTVLFLDEPTNGVDPISRGEFWELLYELLKQKILIILTTAYMDEAEKCEEVHLLNEGQLLASGKPDELTKKYGASSINEIFLLGYSRKSSGAV